MSKLVLRKEMVKGRIDKTDKDPLTDVLYAINSLPGIVDLISNVYSLEEEALKSGKTSLRFHFMVDPQEPQGLFFLTRCTDRRYWENGHKWKIELSVGDTYDKILPVSYMLQSGEDSVETILKECESLFENMNEHIYHNAFMTGFKIDINKFNLMDKAAAKRNVKLIDLGI